MNERRGPRLSREAPRGSGSARRCEQIPWSLLGVILMAAAALAAFLRAILVFFLSPNHLGVLAWLSYPRLVGIVLAGVIIVGGFTYLCWLRHRLSPRGVGGVTKCPRIKESLP